MNKSKIIKNIADLVKEKLFNEGTGHDWFHVERVWKLAKLIAGMESSSQQKVNLLLVEAAALLHDIEDWKFSGDEQASSREAAKILTNLGVKEENIKKITQIIDQVTFKGAGVDTTPSTIEGQIVQDADRLDALGAIGIARAFAYGGHKNRPIYDPKVKPAKHDSFEAYKKHKGTTINHFYEKLLRLKDLINTKSAKKIASQRHQFILDFLDQFFKEWKIDIDRKGNLKD